ncbi:type IV secretory system conjugative DNA transfer family protein [Candidatus Parcubacteria bacterium]|jgi:guanylate kinase|nr:MAG: type IV secretory system conjugative DNA transfer family protein [Candidatus Parcubacteria bacterium]
MVDWLFQPALAQELETAEDATVSSLNVPILIATLGLALVFTVLFFIWLRKRRQQNTPVGLQRVCLQIALPKEQQNEDSGQAASRIQQMQEQISVGESFLSFLGNMRAQRWYNTLGRGRSDHFSLEIVADRGEIKFYAVVPQLMQEFMEQQIHAQYPDAEISLEPEYNPFRPDSQVAAAMLVQKKQKVLPLLTYRHMDVDPLAGLTNALSKLEKDEAAVIQYVCRSSHPRWHAQANAVVHQLQAGKRGSLTSSPAVNAIKNIFSEIFHIFFSKKSSNELGSLKQLSPADEELIQRLQEKNSKAGLDVNVRLVVSGPNQNAASLRLKNIMDAFGQYNAFDTGNGLVKKNPWRFEKIVRDFIYRAFDQKRSALLNIEELAGMWHLPLPSTETPNIHWVMFRTAPPPVNVPKVGVVLGLSRFRGEEHLIRVAREDRRRHIYIIGKSGVGKSVLMTQMALQDIANGDGACVVDPHGDLITDILARLPAHRQKDVVHFNPSDVEYPVGLNMLDAATPEAQDFAVQEMIAIFMKLFPPEVIGPMFEHNMRNVMLTLMADRGNPGTIVEIPRMFTDPTFQKAKVAKVTDPMVRAFWEKEMAKTSDFHKSEMLGYLISKVGRFVENSMMRNVIGQSRSGFDFEEIMNKGKILLVNLAKGTTGEVNANLLGLIIVSKLQMAALRRASLPQEQRKDFFLYIDEFQNFITDSIATILSEARKYRLNLTIAHQYVGQLTDKQDTRIRDAVFGNVGTIVAFRVGVEDADIFAQAFAPVFSQYDVTNMEKYTAIVKLLIDNASSKPFTMNTLPLGQPLPGQVEKLITQSRQNYGRPRAAVEKEILERSQLGVSAPPPMVAERKA